MSTTDLQIDSGVFDRLSQHCNGEHLGFGSTMIPVMYKASFTDGAWQSRTVLPYQQIGLDPAAKVLHYSQEIFEGMKAYSRGAGDPALFRPLENARRMNASAARLSMPMIPEEIFMEGVEAITSLSKPHIPQGDGCSLYIRPFMIGTEASLQLGASRTCDYYVIASPSQSYHSGAMRVMIERKECRAALGGTGAVKVGGNYAAALSSAARAARNDFDQSLWLDPEQQFYIEELSGMNVFALIDGVLHTPELNGSILPGITRDSIIALARHRGYTVIERRMAIKELIEKIQGGNCMEIFACGTAAIVTPISLLGDDRGLAVELPEETPLADEMRSALMALQYGNEKDVFGWMHTISREYGKHVSAA